MLEFSELDFVLISTTMYLLGFLTGLVVCCKNKETFLQRAKSTEDISKYNHHVNSPPIMASAPPLIATNSIGVPLDKTTITIH